MSAGVLVGLEIHQQLDTGRKLFCSCRPAETEEYHGTFRRRLRASSGELGETDPAALFEGAKSKTIEYHANAQSSCLVERDEEPPHALDASARHAALVIALALGSSVFDEIYPMRKTVVDGSNTSGFQRTMMVSRGGSFGAGGRRIGIQSVCLEEDAAKILGEEGGVKRYGLGRLGMPLVEIATEPFEAGPGEIRGIALSLGRILRSTGLVRRGLGSIRQDVNVSVRGGGSVVEVKGVQQLDQLERVVDYEARRQRGMLRISTELGKRKWSHGPGDAMDVTDTFRESESKVIQKAVKQGHRICAVSFKGMGGMFGYSPSEGVRLGKDVAELVRALGLGGVFHSDELPAYGITGRDVEALRGELGAGDGDAFLLLAGPGDRMQAITDQIVGRIAQVRDAGVPRDTRLATPQGETRFMRPRPGAARMYPETDVPPVIVAGGELERARGDVPRPWDESLAELRKKYGLNPQLAGQVFDSRHLGAFERAAAAGADPTFVASSLCSTVTSLEREGLDPGALGDAVIDRTFEMLAGGKIAKESVEIIFREVMGGRARTAEEAVKAASIAQVGEGELERIIVDIAERHAEIIERQGERAAGPLMGIAMKELRGRAPGEAVSRMLAGIIRKRMGAGGGI